MPAFPRLDWSRLQPSRNPWHLAGISAAVGFLLFLIVWLSSLGDDDNATAQTAQESARDNLALPVPLTDGQSVSHMQQPRFPQEAAPTDPQATPTESLPDPLAEPPSDPAVASPPIATTTTSNPSAAPAAGTTTLPVPIQGQTPAPEYPADAMRNNSSGTVMLRVKVSAEGVPDEVDVIERSGDRSLDRAAALAIRQWRFTPAQQDGKAVAGSIDIPISFNLEK